MRLTAGYAPRHRQLYSHHCSDSYLKAAAIDVPVYNQWISAYKLPPPSGRRWQPREVMWIPDLAIRCSRPDRRPESI